MYGILVGCLLSLVMEEEMLSDLYSSTLVVGSDQQGILSREGCLKPRIQNGLNTNAKGVEDEFYMLTKRIDHKI